MTLTLKNVREHRERSQPVHRARLGLLEKHKDYVLRARDYHSKRNRITRLRQKAADRNKDEFYFSMAREATRDGVHIKGRGNVALPVDMVKVLKTQDENYVRTMRSTGRKKIDNIKNQLTTLVDLVEPGASNQTSGLQLDAKEVEALRAAGLLAGPSIGRRRSRHVVFVDNEEQARQYTARQKVSLRGESDPIPEGDCDDASLGWMSRNLKKARTKSQKKTLCETTEVRLQPDTIAEQQRSKKRLIQQLSARLIRDKQLQYTAREFEMQRLLMGRGARRKLKGMEKVENDKSEDRDDDDDEADARKGKRKITPIDEKLYKPRVYKWRQERKR